jgi:TonB family protein
MWFHNMPRSANDPWLKGAQVTVRFAILPDGRSTPPLVTVTSGRASFDKHALDAVDNTPFPPLPPGNGRPLAMCFTFRYNMDEEHRTKPVDLWPPPAKPTASTP